MFHFLRSEPSLLFISPQELAHIAASHAVAPRWVVILFLFFVKPPLVYGSSSGFSSASNIFISFGIGWSLSKT